MDMGTIKLIKQVNISLKQCSVDRDLAVLAMLAVLAVLAVRVVLYKILITGGTCLISRTV